MNSDQLLKINSIISEYFENNKNVNCLTAKDLMPTLIKGGVFAKDEKNGLPLRKVIRALDEINELAKIPTLHAERKDENTYWYFLRPGTSYVSKEVDHPVSKKEERKVARENSDESYLLNLCDEILGEKSIRQHTFRFLAGDVHSDGKTRTRLPLDAYYPKLNLVIEFFEKQLGAKGSKFDNSERETISGVTRAEQRSLYDERKRNVLADKGIDLIDMQYYLFDCDNAKKLKRNTGKDISALKTLLRAYLPKK